MTFQNIIIGLLVGLLGAVFCFVGYRFFRILIAIWGLFAGFELGAAGAAALFGSNFLGTATGWIFGLVVGLVLAVLAYFFYYVAIVLLGASAGYSFGTGLMTVFGLSPSSFLSVLVGVILAVALAILIVVLNLPKLLIMVYTAWGGAIAMLAGLLILFGQINVPILQYGVAVAVVRASWFWTLVAIALAIVGFLTQWRTMLTYNLAWSEAQQA